MMRALVILLVKEYGSVQAKPEDLHSAGVILGIYSQVLMLGRSEEKQVSMATRAGTKLGTAIPSH